MSKEESADVLPEKEDDIRIIIPAELARSDAIFQLQQLIPGGRLVLVKKPSLADVVLDARQYKVATALAGEDALCFIRKIAKRSRFIPGTETQDSGKIPRREWWRDV